MLGLIQTVEYTFITEFAKIGTLWSNILWDLCFVDIHYWKKSYLSILLRSKVQLTNLYLKVTIVE